MMDVEHEDLVQSGLVEPVEIGGVEERLWLDCDLASLAENRLEDRTDPHVLDAVKRAAWRERATTEREYPLASRSEYEVCYWLREGGERVGTLAVGTTAVGGRAARVASFYVFPSHRGRGVGQRALARLTEILSHQRLGIRLETAWSWQRTVRFYLQAGMWVYMWKRDLSLSMSPNMPVHHIEVGEREASIAVRVDGGEIVLQRATRRGEVLELHEMPDTLRKDERLGGAWWQATSTLSLALALAGWPLVRSAEEWERSYFADAGPPEALAHKIQIWEAWDKDHGWTVETPRIAGLSYPTWPELTARWAKERAELEARMQQGGAS
jgi:GNAT superfamily N-acetyltransferase